MSVTQRAVLLWFIYVCIWLVFLARFFYFSHIYPPDSEDRFFVLPKEKSSDSEHLKMFKEVLLSSEALKPKLDRCLKVCHCFILRHACCMYGCIAVQSSRSQLITPFIGQSIFTLFASLAWAFHFLIKLLKNSPNRKKGVTISVVCENLSPIYQIVSEKLSLKKLKSLKNVWAH